MTDVGEILGGATGILIAHPGDVVLLRIPGMAQDKREHVMEFLNRALADTGVVGVVLIGETEIVGVVGRGD